MHFFIRRLLHHTLSRIPLVHIVVIRMLLMLPSAGSRRPRGCPAAPGAPAWTVVAKSRREKITLYMQARKQGLDGRGHTHSGLGMDGLPDMTGLRQLSVSSGAGFGVGGLEMYSQVAAKTVILPGMTRNERGTWKIIGAIYKRIPVEMAVAKHLMRASAYL